MPKQQIDYGNLPYGYWFDRGLNVEYLFGRHYQPLAERRFLDHDSARTIAFYRGRGRDWGEPWQYGPTIDFDFAGWYYKDGNPPKYDRSTLKRVRAVWKAFMCGQDVRPFFYTTYGDEYVFPDGGRIVLRGKRPALEFPEPAPAFAD